MVDGELVRISYSKTFNIVFGWTAKLDKSKQKHLGNMFKERRTDLDKLLTQRENR